MVITFFPDYSLIIFAAVHNKIVNCIEYCSNTRKPTPRYFAPQVLE